MNAHSKLPAAPEESTALVTIPDEAEALTVFSSVEGIEPWIQIVRDAVDAYKAPDFKTAAGRKAIKAFAMKVTRSKTALEAVGKKVAADAKALPKKIDATRRYVEETLDALADQVRKPVDDYEDAEAERTKAHAEEIDVIESYGRIDPNATAEEIEAALRVASRVQIDAKSCEEFEPQYAVAKEGAVKALNEALDRRQTYEREQAELAELRRLQAEREAKDRAEAEAQAIAEAARIKAEADAAAKIAAVEAAAKAERDAAELRERQAKEAEEKRIADAAAEAQRIAAETVRREREAADALADANRKAEQAEADARAKIEQERLAEAAAEAARKADIEHRAAINRAAVAALMEGGLEEAEAKIAVNLIAQEKVPAVSIRY